MQPQKKEQTLLLLSYSLALRCLNNARQFNMQLGIVNTPCENKTN